MFRYIAFNWQPAAPAQVAFANLLEASIGRTAGWRLAFSTAGLRVYTIGSRPGVNSAYVLPGNQGVVLGRIFRRHEQGTLSGDIALSADDGERILKSGGRALIEKYWGRYVAILRPGQGGTRVLRDPTGTLPCHRIDVGGATVVLSWLEDLPAHAPAVALRVDWDAIAARLALGTLGGEATALQGVSQILPGRLTSLDEGIASSTTLWSAAAVARDAIDEELAPAAALLRQAVVDSVHAWSCCHDAILLRLSGGVDSAILLGSLRSRVAASRITCLNYHSPGADSDERGYARLAAARAGVELVEKARNADFRLEDILAVGLTPTPESYVGRMGTGRIDAEVAAAHGARALFTGAGGDQLFFQIRCTWPAADYLRRHGLGRGFVHASLHAARLGRVSLWRSMRCALADRHHRSSPWDSAKGFATLLREDATDGMRRLDRYVHPDLLQPADLPIGKFHQVRALIHSSGYYDPYLREAAPELINPLLSQPVIELCLALPTWLLTHGGRGRALARHAFADDMPREIATRRSKGGMEAHVATVLRRNLPLARELLLDGQLVRQGLLDRQKVEAALAAGPATAGAYPAEIHDGLAVEAWVRRLPRATGALAA